MPSKQQGAWELARDILEARYRGVVQPLWFGHDLTAQEQIQHRGKPLPSILSAIELVARLGGRVVAEVGCMRHPLAHPLEEFHPECCNDGHSTAYWAAAGLEVYTADIDPASVAAARETCGAMPNVRIECRDGIEFLRTFPRRIDLLYLDAWDAIEGTPYAERHLEAFEAAREKMAPRSIVLVDDTDVAWGGKGRLAIPAIIRAGYEPVVHGRQTMLLRV